MGHLAKCVYLTAGEGFMEFSGSLGVKTTLCVFPLWIPILLQLTRCRGTC